MKPKSPTATPLDTAATSDAASISLSLLQTLSDAVPVLICYVDAEHRYRFNNVAYERWFGYSREQITGKHLREVMGEEAYKTLQPAVERALAGEHVDIETRVAYRDAGIRDIAVSYIPHRADDRVLGYTALIHDVTERKKIAAALKHSEERYRAFVANSSEGIWRYELDQPLDLSLTAEEQLAHMYKYARLAELNDAMARMYGYEQAEALLDAPLGLLLPPDDAAARAYLMSVIDIGYAFTEVESAERDKDGNLHFFENSMVPVIRDGKLLRAWGVQRDITARKSAEDALREADRRKDTFLATLAHELRNPLAPIRNGLQILDKRIGAEDEIAQRTITMMQRQMTHLVRLVDDLLDVSRITRGKLQLKLQRVAVVDLVRSATEACRSLFDTAGHHFEVQLPAESLHVDADPDRLVQVISNLLSNAAKFTSTPGRIVLRVSREGESVHIEVRDTGIGIASDQLDRVFEAFLQLDQHGARGQGGLGIGLSLVRELVHMHGGTAAALSDGAGQGSTFVVRLPLAAASAVIATERERQQSSDATLRALRILVADDNLDAALSLSMLLEIEGHEVQTVANGAQAVERFDTFKPHVILMDVGMPVMDGVEAARRIRESYAGANVPIVALTGWGQEADRERTRDAGMSHHLVKPVSAEDLRAVLASLLV
jgi:PAS domain S-box-containing protein